MTAPAAAPVSGAIVAAHAARGATDRDRPLRIRSHARFAARRSGESGLFGRGGRVADFEPAEAGTVAVRAVGRPSVADRRRISVVLAVCPAVAGGEPGPGARPSTPRRPRRPRPTGRGSRPAAPPTPRPCSRRTRRRQIDCRTRVSPGSLDLQASAPPPACQLTDAPSFGPSPAGVESEAGAPRPATLAPLSTPGRAPAQDGRISPPSVAAASLSPAEMTPARDAATAMSRAAEPIAPRAAGGQANPPANPVRTAAPDPARGARKADAAALSPARAASSAVPPPTPSRSTRPTPILPIPPQVDSRRTKEPYSARRCPRPLLRGRRSRLPKRLWRPASLPGRARPPPPRRSRRRPSRRSTSICRRAASRMSR